MKRLPLMALLTLGACAPAPMLGLRSASAAAARAVLLFLGAGFACILNGPKQRPSSCDKSR